MYYKYQLISDIIDSIDAVDDLHFHINLRENMYFIIGGCYFNIKKNHDHTFIMSDRLEISCFLHNKNNNEAKEKLQQALEFFIFLTGTPYDTKGQISETTENSLPLIDINQSKKKMIQIQNIENAYQRIRTKKNLLVNSLHLFSMGTKLNFLFDETNCEDAFFTLFKIIENIVKDDFSIEKNNINRNQSLTHEYVNTIITSTYGIQTTSERLQEISGIIDNTIFESVFDNIYHKIIWFAHNHNITVDSNILSKIVAMRNQIAHGDSIKFETCIHEYKYTISLCRKIIQAKFFNLSMPIIEAQIIVL